MALSEMTTQSSETALAVLMFLAVAGTERELAVRFEDSIGSRMIDWSDGQYAFGKVRFLHPLFRRVAAKSDPGTYGFMVARALHMDDVIRKRTANGLDQLVILGAGYDTRFHRLRRDLAGVRVFEVDLPATSRDKRARLEKVLGSVPGDVSYVEVDFNRKSPFDRLAEHGYDTSAQTLFVLSGVSMYLPESAVLDLFSQVAGRSTAGSSILFDYFFDDLMTHPGRYYGGQEWIARVTKLGEEPHCGIAMERVGELLAGCGLELDSQYDMTELARRYLRRANGAKVLRPFEFAAVAQAVVPG